MDEIKARKSFSFILFSLFLLSLGASDSAFAGNLSAAGAPKLMLASNNAFIFNPRTLSWKAVGSNGNIIKTGKASGGRGYCPDIRRSCRTPSGTYQVMSKRGADCRSSRYPVGRGGAKMPYCMFFSKYYAIHGSYDVPNYNASHGCIRVKPQDALWLHQNFIKIGTKVIVKPY